MAYIDSLTNPYVVLAVTVLFTFWFRIRRSNLPPGPWGLPIIGCLFRLGGRPYKTFNDWAKVYGDVFSVRLGTELVVVLNSHKAIKDAFVKRASQFSSRPQVGSYTLPQNKGIISSLWPVCRDLRRQCRHILHELGMAKRATEERIHEENEYLVSSLRELNGEPTDLEHLVMNAVSNITCNMLFGKRFEYDDDNFRHLLETLSDFEREIDASSVLTFIPLLWHLPIPAATRLRHSFEELSDSVTTEIDEHLLTKPPDSERESFIDTYSLLKKKYQNLGSSDDNLSEIFGDDEYFKRSVTDLFIGGSSTTSVTLLWGLLYLCLNPDVQEKCFQEIKDVIGLDTAPTYADKSRLPYLEAVALEIQRMASISPLGLPHEPQQDADLYGYTIPKGTMVLANLWAVHKTSRYWANPDMFDPSRFLDENDKVVNREKIIPFSIGGRDCIGSGLAKMQIFLFLSRWIQEFQFKLPDGEPIPPLEGRVASLLQPESYKIVALKRKE